jgi:hypothetical protein
LLVGDHLDAQRGLGPAEHQTLGQRDAIVTEDLQTVYVVSRELGARACVNACVRAVFGTVTRSTPSQVVEVGRLRDRASTPPLSPMATNADVTSRFFLQTDTR